jgi:CHAD domain-containing protein
MSGARGEAIGDAVARSVRLELERALAHLRGSSKRPRRSDAQATEIVHEVRKSFKKIRAALRLLREDLGDDVYRDENLCFRDAARPLAELRDADMLLEAFDALSPLVGDRVHAACAAKAHEALLANRQEVLRRVLDEESALATVAEVVTRALTRIADWRTDPNRRGALGGLRRVYRAGRRAMSRARASSRVEDLHEWRKQVKYLWHQHQILQPVGGAAETDRADRVHALSRLLGEDHDLAVLRQTFAAQPSAYGGHGNVKRMCAILDARRAELEKRAFELGGVLYDKPPRAFAVDLAPPASKQKGPNPRRRLTHAGGI